MIKNILVIDNDIENFKEIAENLQDETTEVHYAATIQIALQKIAAYHFCLIILDVLLSGGGHEVIVELRNRTAMPILALSEQAATADKVLALDSGADDFLAKPYDMDECLAQARALLRRYTELNHITQRGYVVVGPNGIMIDTARRMVSIAGNEIRLMRKEYELLIYFIKNHDIVLSYEQIYQGVWKDDYLGNSKVISFWVRQLRKKFKDSIKIQSLSGIGYCFKIDSCKIF